MTIQDIKTHLRIEEVLNHYGLRPKNNMLNCPFHDDKTPSMQVYPKTDTVYCFSGKCRTHGKALDVIGFIEEKEQCSTSEAIQKAKSLLGETTTTRVETEKPVLEPVNTVFLSRLFQRVERSLRQSPAAKEYVKSRGLVSTEIGFNKGTLHRYDVDMNHATYLRHGLIYPSGKGHASIGSNSLTFPLRNREGKICSFYYRSIDITNKKPHRYLKTRQGLYPGYPDAKSKRVILTESVIDAASLLEIPIIREQFTVLALYGTNGYTAEHEKGLLQLNNLEEIVLFFDGDEAGEEARKHYTRLFKEKYLGVLITGVDTEEGLDPNSLFVDYEEAAIMQLIADRKPVEIDLVVPDIKLAIPVKDGLFNSYGLDLRDTDFIRYELNGIRFTLLGGLGRGMKALDSMKVTLKVEPVVTINRMHSYRTTLDLYNDDSLESYIRKAAEKLERTTSEIKPILYSLVDKLEAYRLDKRKEELRAGEKQAVKLSEAEKEKALKLLKDPALMESVMQHLQLTGLVGEQENGMLLFIIFLTRFFSKPLHALVHGSSGSGKSNLLHSIASLLPKENYHSTTALTENVLFYPPYKDFWKHKVLLLEDLDGSYKALLPLREFMSNQHISKFMTETDPKTGVFRQRKLEAEGPICIAGATTKDRVYEDNANRSFLLHVNESRKQQQAVMEYQNKWAAGLVNEAEKERSKTLLQNAQRLLEPIRVVNPFQPELTLPESIFKPLRTNTHYITLIQAITFLHQYQLPVKQDSTGGSYIETHLKHIEWANRLSKESLIRKSDELSGAVRDFFERLKYWLSQENKDTFYSKQIREAFRMYPMKTNRYLNDLDNRGYIKRVGGNKKVGFEYSVQKWDDYKAIKKHVHLLDEKLKALWKKYPDGVYKQVKSNRSITAE